MKLGLAPLLLLAACAAPVAAPAYDVALSPELASQATTAVALWTAAVPALRLRLVDECAGNAVCVVAVHGASPGPGVVGRTEAAPPHRVRVFVDTLSADAASSGVDYTVQTIAHELGHAMMGTEHLGAGSLMAWDVPEQADRPGPEDVAHFWETR